MFTPSVLLDKARLSTLEHMVDTGILGNVVFLIGTLAALVLYVYGTFVLSSLLFIGSADAAIVLGRYAVSAAVVRVVLLFELEGMTLVAASE